jgi:hypothetical protein
MRLSNVRFNVHPVPGVDVYAPIFTGLSDLVEHHIWTTLSTGLDNLPQRSLEARES